MFELYPFQQEIIESTRAEIRAGHKSVLVTAPTGSGKTVISGFMTGNAARRGNRVFFLCHRAELLEQTLATYRAVGIDAGVIAAGYGPELHKQVQICSVQTLVRRYRKVPMPRLVIWDEAHHVAAGSWARLMEFYTGAIQVGLTATPERLDGKGLGEYFKVLVRGPSVEQLISDGYLAQYKLYAPSTPDVSGVHTKMGDFDQKELAEIMRARVLTGDAIQHYNKLGKGMQAIVYCVNVAHSKEVAYSFNSRGIKATHIDGKMARISRRAAVDDFRQGRVKVLTNCEIATEGFDLPQMGVAILLRPTQSLSLYLQMCGRALRTAPGKEHAVILDHAGNTLRHGLPCQEREWSLAGRKKRKGNPSPIRECPECYYVHPAALNICPECGHSYIGMEPKERKIETQEGELQEVDKAAMRRYRKREQAGCDSLQELEDLGKRRGYKRPHAWAAHVWTSRQANKIVRKIMENADA